MPSAQTHWQRKRGMEEELQTQQRSCSLSVTLKSRLFLCASWMQCNQIQRHHHSIYYTTSAGKLFLERSCRTRRQLEIFCSSLKRLLQIRCSSTFLKDDHSWSPLQTCCLNQTSRQGHVQKSFKQVHHSCWIIYDYMPSTQTRWQRTRAMEEGPWRDQNWALMLVKLPFSAVIAVSCW